MKLRTFGKILAALTALMIATLIAVPFFIPADYLKGQVIAQVKQAIGRDLLINGKTSLELFPVIAVSVEDVTLGNPQGFVSPYFVHIDKLKTGAALGPLLDKQLSITGITLEGMQLNLEENNAGAKNWEFTLQKAKAQTQESIAQKEQKSSSRTSFTLGDVTVKNSTISYSKPGSKPVVVRDIALTLSGADSKPLKLNSRFHYQNEPVELQLAVDQLKKFLAGDPSSVTVAVSLPYASKLQFEGAAAMKEDLAANGQLTVNLADLPKLIAWATGKPASAGMPKNLALETKLTSTSSKAFTLDTLRLIVDTLTATGKLAANLNGAVPAISGALQIADLNLDTFSGGANGGESAANASAVATPSATRVDGWSDKQIDASGLKSANADLTLTIGQLRSGKLLVEKIAAQVQLLNGQLAVNVANASLYSGTAKGTVSLDGSGTAVALGSNLTLSGIQIEPLMTALSGTSRVSGAATIALTISGRGASERAIVGSLGGNGSASMRDGAIKGINIAQFLRNVKKGFLFSDDSNVKTDFSALNASFTMAQGVATNNDLSLQSPILRVSGSGTVNLPERRVNYRLVPTIVGTLEGQGGKTDEKGLAVPLNIVGPWSNPSVTPDLQGMIQDGLKNPDALKQNLKDIKGTLKNFNSPKDLGRALFGGKAQ